MLGKDEQDIRRIQAAIAPKLIAQVIEDFCEHSGADKDAWFAAFSARYLAPMAALQDKGRYFELSRVAAEELVKDTRRAMHPNIRPR